MISNTAGRIAELRREMHRQRGLAKRAAETARYKRSVAGNAEAAASRLVREIEGMGGKVKR